MLPALSQSLRLKAGLNIPEVHVGKVVGFFFLMLKMVYYFDYCTEFLYCGANRNWG